MRLSPVLSTPTQSPSHSHPHSHQALPAPPPILLLPPRRAGFPRPRRLPLGITECHPSFLTLAPTLKGCSKRYERFCQKYRHHSKGAPKCHWGSRMLKRLVETSGSRSKSKRISPGQTQLPFAFDLRLSQIPEEWHQIAVRFRRANGIRDGDRERSIW